MTAIGVIVALIVAVVGVLRASVQAILLVTTTVKRLPKPRSAAPRPRLPGW